MALSMEVNIKPLMSSMFKVYCVGDENTIEYIKYMISMHHIPGLNVNNFQLCYQGLLLKDTDTLGKIGIQHESTLMLVLKYRTGY